MQTLSDKELWQAVQADSEPAFRVLFERHFQRLCYTAYRICPDEHKVRDFAQAVFLDCWKRRHAISIHSSLSSFLSRAVVNKAIDFLRSQRLEFVATDTFIGEPDPVNQHELYTTKELKNIINKAVEKLPERCRIIFVLSRFEHYSHREIAQELNISEKTVENQITKALKVLRAVLKQYQGELSFFYLFFHLA